MITNVVEKFEIVFVLKEPRKEIHCYKFSMLDEFIAWMFQKYLIPGVLLCFWFSEIELFL